MIPAKNKIKVVILNMDLSVLRIYFLRLVILLNYEPWAAAWPISNKIGNFSLGSGWTMATTRASRVAGPLAALRNVHSDNSFKICSIWAFNSGIFLHNIPDNAITDTEVLVGGNISKSTDFTPFCQRKRQSKFLWHVLGSFTDDFQVTQSAS